eukprot:189174-Rhodomonas_salina.2
MPEVTGGRGFVCDCERCSCNREQRGCKTKGDGCGWDPRQKRAAERGEREPGEREKERALACTEW